MFVFRFKFVLPACLRVGEMFYIWNGNYTQPSQISCHRFFNRTYTDGVLISALAGIGLLIKKEKPK